MSHPDNFPVELESQIILRLPEVKRIFFLEIWKYFLMFQFKFGFNSFLIRSQPQDCEKP